MRLSIVAACLSLCLIGISSANDARASIRKLTNIPAEGLGPALNSLAKDRNFQIVYVTEEIANVRTEGAVGEFTTDEALKRLLTGTGLTYRYLDDKTVTIGSATTPHERSSQTSKATPSGLPDYSNANQEGKKSSSGEFRVAQVDQGKNPSTSPITNSSSPESSLSTPGLSEIIVTAQKRSERLLDVPMAVSALSGDELTRAQSFRFEDYVAKVPGLTLVDGYAGSQLVIRGITSGGVAVNSSVATYIDETPYAVQGAFAGAFFIAPNLDTFDIQRIEVLKGPQGTVYGANALAGVLKFVTNAPDSSGFKTTVETGISSVEHGGTGFDVHAMVNLPISNDAALRLVGYDNHYPGFIDDPSRSLHDTNDSRFSGGRASLLYSPASDFSIRLNALYQTRQIGDSSTVDLNPVNLKPIYGDLIQQKLIDNSGRTIVQLYNVTMDWDVGSAKLLSTSSYYENQVHFFNDGSGMFGPLFSAALGTPYGAALDAQFQVHAFTQELRASSQNNGPMQWLFGGYFTTDDANELEGLYPVNIAARQILFNFSPTILLADVPTHYKEYAAFTNLNFHITPTVDVGVGGRYSHNNQTFSEFTQGILGSPPVSTNSSEGVFTYSGDARWHFTPESMLYARIAKGFVPGGPNDVVPTASGIAPTYTSSTTVNYELGIKSQLFEKRLTVELDAFDIEWRDIQLQAVIGGFGVVANGGTARSQGAEWSVGYMPLDGLTLAANGAYTDAYLTEATPASVNGHVDDRLPAAPLWGASASADYKRVLHGDYTGFAGVNWRFTGTRYADFSAVGPRQILPNDNIFDARAGVETHKWSVALYVKNIGNRLAINYVQPETAAGGAGPQSAWVYTPRTLGVTVTGKWE